MALSLRNFRRLELQDLLTQYADIIDRKAFSELSSIFIDDAVIDYEATGPKVQCRGDDCVPFRGHVAFPQPSTSCE